MDPAGRDVRLTSVEVQVVEPCEDGTTGCNQFGKLKEIRTAYALLDVKLPGFVSENVILTYPPVDTSLEDTPPSNTKWGPTTGWVIFTETLRISGFAKVCPQLNTHKKISFEFSCCADDIWIGRSKTNSSFPSTTLSARFVIVDNE
jgi:hypothetical protein